MSHFGRLGWAVAAVMLALTTCGGVFYAQSSRGGAVEVGRNGEKEPLVRMTGIQLVFDGKRYECRFADCRTSKRGLEVECSVPTNCPAKDVRVSALFAAEDSCVRVRWRLHGIAPEDKFAPRLSMFSRIHPCGYAKGEVRRSIRWVRDEDGGQPFEQVAGEWIVYRTGGTFAYSFNPEFKSNAGWQSAYAQHLVFVERPGGDYISEFKIGDLEETVDVGIRLGTEASYGIFTNAAPLSFQVALEGNGPGSAMLSAQVRDFDGRLWLDRCVAASRDRMRFSFNPSCERGIFFVEVSLRDAKSGVELAFARTNLARLPPHSFRDGPDNSPFGLSAYWPEPSEEAVQDLMDRMGVRWVRGGDGRLQHKPRVAIRHSGGTQFVLGRHTPEERRKWIVGELEQCKTNRNAYWEFGNELNWSNTSIGIGTCGIGKAAAAPQYCEWVREIDREIREGGYGVKLLSAGVSGYDERFIRAIAERGCWDMIKGVCLHPGRGNFAPDYPLVHPERGIAVKTDDPLALSERVEHSSYWNYYGSVRDCARLISRLGRKDLFLTEVYAPTFPNSWWEDTQRGAAENVVLTYVLAKVEGVRAAFYYQLFDSVWYDRFGANPKDREYHFGLINRDRSVKPAFMAYCAVAEHLDGAKFDGWMKPLNETSHAVWFKTPRGPLAVIWDRVDGYELTRHEKGKRYLSPEPWQDEAVSSTSVKLAAGRRVRVYDAIGRRLPAEAVDGILHLRLTRAPLFVYGLSREKFK